jgi:Caspase domain
MKPHKSPLKRRACSLIIILLSATVAFPQAGGSRGVGVKVRAENGETLSLYEESHALVIGVSDYTNGWRSLPGVKRDVAAVESVLHMQGFKVETIVNPKGRDLDQAIKDFIARNGQAFGNRLLIYFAGHGATLRTSDGREMGYIVPADAPLASSNIGQFKQTAISMNMIEDYALMIDSKHALFVFDCCFSGSLFENNRAGTPPAAITARTLLPVRQFITAGTADQEVPDSSIFRE